MVYHGHVRNGRIELEDDVLLPEGTAVEVRLPLGQEDELAGVSLYDRLKPVIGAAKGLPADASTQVDHYLYGQPKE